MVLSEVFRGIIIYEWRGSNPTRGCNQTRIMHVQVCLIMHSRTHTLGDDTLISLEALSPNCVKKNHGNHPCASEKAKRISKIGSIWPRAYHISAIRDGLKVDRLIRGCAAHAYTTFKIQSSHCPRSVWTVKRMTAGPSVVRFKDLTLIINASINESLVIITRPTGYIECRTTCGAWTSFSKPALISIIIEYVVRKNKREL